MNKLNIEPVNQGKINIQVKDIADGVLIDLAGEIDMQDPSVILDPLFDAVHTGSVASGFKSVQADFRNLTFLNSSGIKAMAKWIMKLATIAADKRYEIKILYNKEISWQTTSLPTLTFLAPGLVKLE